MRIVVISDWFSEKMGYAENALPKALAKQGHDVHVITSDLHPYADLPNYRQVYESFLGPAQTAVGSWRIDGFRLLRLHHAWMGSRIYLRGLSRELREIRPHIVQTFDCASPSTAVVTLLRPLLGYQVFTGNHLSRSGFIDTRFLTPLRRMRLFLSMFIPGRLIALQSRKCYSVTQDCAEIAEKFYGVPKRKNSIVPLGVDTDLFRPVDADHLEAERDRIRRELGYGIEGIVCIYTGRLTQEKNPLCLADAIDVLNKEGLPFYGLFIGDGADEMRERIAGHGNCTVMKFLSHEKLAAYYRASDIAVWPVQETTSFFDAIACGIPIVISDRICSADHIIRLCGRKFAGGDAHELARVLATLTQGSLRRELGGEGVRMIRRSHSWSSIALSRLADYRQSLKRSGALENAG